MNVSERGRKWLDGASVPDLIECFPMSIALLDEAGGLLVMNDHFERTYGPEALHSAPLRELIRNPVPGWTTVRVPSRGPEPIEKKAQALRVHGNTMLILDDAEDDKLLRELEQLHEQITELERISSIDIPTGAWNRTHFDRVVASELDRSLRFKQPVSMILLDVDQFKQVNDTYGHQVGDAVLRELVQVIGAAMRSIDALFRWGGEEFVVLASSTGYRAAAMLAEKIRAAVEQHRFGGIESVTVSLGVAEHVATESAESWWCRADAALYRAKDGGRNQVSVDWRGSSDAWTARSCPSAIRLRWQEAYECGEPTIDGEHRELFELANTVLDAAFQSKSSPEVFNPTLDKFIAHIAQHFADEERLLAKRGYADLEAHRKAHAGLLARAAELKASAAAGKTTLGDLVEFLANNVVAQHLFEEDRKFFPLFDCFGRDVALQRRVA